ncbi:uncharacterized protein LOC131888705 isoform X2 [Tigriopus californicus]|uniref:uncharacterized protein LOC131888705 isoform X2 n=1 Tax=Tigriopus californicus TaxID=6832 RepID=UPI0027DA2BED|nr:uncharacterized protein LOC131888705 isoform X2 [Tigriopus californicus]
MSFLILVLTTATCVEQSISSQDKWLWFFPSASNLPSPSCTFCSTHLERHQILRLILKRVLAREVNHHHYHRHFYFTVFPLHHRYRLFHTTHIRRNKEWEESHKRKNEVGLYGDISTRRRSKDKILDTRTLAQERRHAAMRHDKEKRKLSGSILKRRYPMGKLDNIGRPSSTRLQWEHQTPLRINSKTIPNRENQPSNLEARMMAERLRPPMRPTSNRIRKLPVVLNSRVMPKRDSFLKSRLLSWSSPKQPRTIQPPLDRSDVARLIRSLEAQSQASHLQAIKELEQNEKKGLKMQKYVNSKGTMVAILGREQGGDAPKTQASFHNDVNEQERRQSFANAISENSPLVELGTEYDSIDENESRRD